MGRKIEPPKLGHVVKDFWINDEHGHTHVLICDDYCVKTKEEEDEILYRIGDIYMDALLRKQEEQEAKKKNSA